MTSQTAFIKFSKVIVVTVFMVILAGGVVRMTQSGMGCPDWPKCFGRWVPPTREDQLPLNYKELYSFKYVDTSFNPYHTWIEYINRMLGALLGLLLLVQFIWSCKFFNLNRRVVWLSLALLLLTGFQGWLGSKVVATNLEAVKVTIHMLTAVIISALSVTIVHAGSSNRPYANNKKLKNISLTTLILLTIQIILGTQVREQIDHISAGAQFRQRDTWISKLDHTFDIHRTFSIVIAGVCIYLFFKYKKYPALQISTRLIFICVLSNIFLGIVMAYFDIPSIAQPLHLLLSCILVTAVYYNWLRTV